MSSVNVPVLGFGSGSQVVILRATTRKAEWENIHWTGRTEFPFTCQGRRMTSNVSGSAKPPSSAYRSHSCFTWIVEGKEERTIPPGARASRAWGTAGHG